MTAKRGKWPGKRFLYSTIGTVITVALTIGASVYAKRVLNTTELVHFFIPFPAGKVVRPMTIDGPDGRRFFVRPLAIDVNRRGFLKRLFNPGIEGVSTHWLINTGGMPYRIGMKLTNVNVPVRWEVGAGIPWDPESRTFTEAVDPGQSVPDLGVDWLFEFSKETRSENIWYDGELVIYDADTGKDLTIIPLKFFKEEGP
jgi:hypothetical protein